MRACPAWMIVFIASACTRAAEPLPPPAPAPTLALPAAVPVKKPDLAECAARHFAASAVPGGLQLANGAVVPLSDGRTKSFEETLGQPDLEDMFSPPYAVGPIAPVTSVDHDPGRVRVEALFEATYGASEKAVRAELVPVTLAGHTVLVHRRAKAALDRVSTRIAALLAADPSLHKYFDPLGGTFVFRTIAGTERRSTHAFGIAVDLNPAHAHYWRNDATPRWKNSIPAAIVAAFEAEEFVWGGRWYHYDTMHFEWRPELFACTAR